MTAPKKELGQHWLFDEDSLQAMCGSARLKTSDTVLEIGPGLGTLTSKLVHKVRKVIAVEVDAGLARKLPAAINAGNLEIHHSDILTFDLTELPSGYKVVANIPYYLTSNLVRVLSESTNPPQSATLLVQKEVAERIAALPGSMSLLSVTAQAYFELELGMAVPARLFKPPPKVDSRIIHLERRRKPLYAPYGEKQFFRTVKAGFSNRRKTLLNSLSAGFMLSKEQTLLLLEEAQINPQSRPQELRLEDWIRLAGSL